MYRWPRWLRPVPPLASRRTHSLGDEPCCSIGCTRFRIKENEMSILARFTSAPSMNAKKYDDAMPKIEASGQWPPDGMQFHVAFEADGVFRVSEIWESQEKFEAFGQRLMPILQQEGIELAGPPEVLPVHNIVKP